MYIQEYRKKVTNLLKICQMAFNHGAMGHPANREQRSKPSSGAISLESLWSSALFEFNLLCHRVRIHSGGQIFQRDGTQCERHPVFTKMFYVAGKPRLRLSITDDVCTQLFPEIQGLLSSFQGKPFVSLYFQGEHRVKRILCRISQGNDVLLTQVYLKVD